MHLIVGETCSQHSYDSGDNREVVNIIDRREFINLSYFIAEIDRLEEVGEKNLNDFMRESNCEDENSVSETHSTFSSHP